MSHTEAVVGIETESNLIEADLASTEIARKYAAASVADSAADHSQVWVVETEVEIDCFVAVDTASAAGTVIGRETVLVHNSHFGNRFEVVHYQ